LVRSQLGSDGVEAAEPVLLANLFSFALAWRLALEIELAMTQG
jgi:hypothetical protein